MLRKKLTFRWYFTFVYICTSPEFLIFSPAFETFQRFDKNRSGVLELAKARNQLRDGSVFAGIKAQKNQNQRRSKHFFGQSLPAKATLGIQRGCNRCCDRDAVDDARLSKWIPRTGIARRCTCLDVAACARLCLYVPAFACVCLNMPCGNSEIDCNNFLRYHLL